MKRILWAVVAFLGFFGQVASAAECNQWFAARGNPKGVVLLTHGMNLKPACMDPLALELSGAGYEVFRPAFTGHCGPNEAYLNVSAAQWEADAKRFHGLAAAKAAALKKPLYLVAYSFTAPVFQTQSQDLPFRARVYFAPALATKFWFPVVKWIANVFPNFTYQSRVPAACAANPVSGMRPLSAYAEILRRWNQGAGKNDATPILAFAEPNDELVDYQGLQTIAADKNNWNIHAITNAGTTMPKSYHHLVVTPASLGTDEWARVVGSMISFLGQY